MISGECLELELALFKEHFIPEVERTARCLRIRKEFGHMGLVDNVVGNFLSGEAETLDGAFKGIETH